MTTRFPIKITRIGNSRGVRIPSAVINQLGLDRAGLTAEIRADGLLLTAQKNKLSWAETAQAMAQAKEDWSDLENASADGLADL
ncbi:MAG: AbrB/MazE/SpoVT family DNA-binding domain-containing protein [Opitutaceae bacterium]|nr:AbrB/MazE/SpoVT family DNA-binding domain-containing protein [Opitutaceae bacterium]